MNATGSHSILTIVTLAVAATGPARADERVAVRQHPVACPVEVAGAGQQAVDDDFERHVGDGRLGRRRAAVGRVGAVLEPEFHFGPRHHADGDRVVGRASEDFPADEIDGVVAEDGRSQRHNGGKDGRETPTPDKPDRPGIVGQSSRSKAAIIWLCERAARQSSGI